MKQLDILMIKVFFIILFAFSVCKSDKDEFNWKKNIIPIYGQIQNKKYAKAILLGSSQIYAANQFLNYNHNENIGKRNTYSWWIIGLYFYGLIDAYVDFNLKNFPKNKEE